MESVIVETFLQFGIVGIIALAAVRFGKVLLHRYEAQLLARIETLESDLDDERTDHAETRRRERKLLLTIIDRSGVISDDSVKAQVTSAMDTNPYPETEMREALNEVRRELSQNK